MSDPSPISDPSADPTGNPDPNSEPAKTPDLQVELDKWKAEARKHEDRAKANAKAAKELETLKASQMSDTEKAISDAVSKAKNEWKTETGTKLALTEFKAKASSRMDEAKINALLPGLNVSVFLNDEGEPNSEAIDSFLNTFVPPKSSSTNFGQGAQGTGGQGSAVPLNSDDLTQAVFNLFSKG